jgi:hypothetical protein
MIMQPARRFNMFEIADLIPDAVYTKVKLPAFYNRALEAVQVTTTTLTLGQMRMVFTHRDVYVFASYRTDEDIEAGTYTVECLVCEPDLETLLVADCIIGPLENNGEEPRRTVQVSVRPAAMTDLRGAWGDDELQRQLGLQVLDAIEAEFAMIKESLETKPNRIQEPMPEPSRIQTEDLLIQGPGLVVGKLSHKPIPGTMVVSIFESSTSKAAGCEPFGVIAFDADGYPSRVTTCVRVGLPSLQFNLDRSYVYVDTVHVELQPGLSFNSSVAACVEYTCAAEDAPIDIDAARGGHPGGGITRIVSQ